MACLSPADDQLREVGTAGQFLMFLLEEGVDGTVWRAVEDHPGGASDGLDLLRAAAGSKCRALDADTGPGKLLHQFTCATVLAHEPALPPADIAVGARFHCQSH